MLCQNCNQEQASFHYTQIVNGQKSEFHLCPTCAGKLGYENVGNWEGSPLGLDLNNFLGNMLHQAKQVKPKSSVVCPLCGAGQDDLARTGRVGCAQCYTVFGDILRPLISQLHGNASHTGRVPEGADDDIKTRRRLENLENRLKTAVDTQEYEEAAKLRDEINELKGEINHG